jgi:hypothetical protein
LDVLEDFSQADRVGRAVVEQRWRGSERGAGREEEERSRSRSLMKKTTITTFVFLFSIVRSGLSLLSELLPFLLDATNVKVSIR